MASDPPGVALGDIDRLWMEARDGDAEAFAGWAGRVERPVRRSLSRFAAYVDAEGIVQETLVRMWQMSQDAARELTGENASLRWAIVMARNLALNEARKMKRHAPAPIEVADDEPVLDAERDPLLMQRIRDCAAKLTGQLARVMQARLDEGEQRPDARIAARLQMTKNTFLQNMVRARRKLVECLEGFGIRAEDLVR